MNETQEIRQTITNNKKIALKKLIEEMNDEKLVILQTFLDESSIDYDDDIVDYYKLVSSLKKKLDKDTKKIVLDKCEQIDKSFQELIDGLSNGSTTSFDNFMRKTFNIVKPVSVGLAINTAVQLAPTPVTKLVPMGIGVLYSGYKLCKNYKYKKVIDKEEKLNLKIQSREFKYDEKGNLIDTRFTNEEQALIRTKLKELKIEFKDFGYQSLRTIIYSLPYEKKVQLVMSLEGKTNRADFDKELKKYNSISTIEKHRFVPITTIVTAEALEQLSLLNIIQTTGLVALNGMVAARLTENLTGNNRILSTLAGLMTSGATLTGLDSPIIQVETVLISVIIAEIIRVVAKTIRAIKNGANNKKIGKKFLEIENEKYINLDNEEKKLLQDYINNTEISNHIGESIIIEVITQYIRNNLKVDINTPKNIHQLGLIVNSLNSHQQKKIHKLMEEFKHFNKNPNNQFIRKLEKMLKATGITAIFGLAGMSIVDIFTQGEFLSGISERLFFVDAPDPFVVEVEHVSTVTNDPGLGLIRNNENGEHILETTYTANVGNEAFNTHCNFYHDPNWLMEETGMTIDEYMGHYTLEDYQNYKNVADVLLESPYFKEADILQISKFKEFLEMMIKKREQAEILSEAGIAVATTAAVAGIIRRDKKNKVKVKRTIN